MARGQRGRGRAAWATAALALAGALGGAAGAEKEKAMVQASRIEEHPVDVSIGGKGVQFGDLPGFTRSVVETVVREGVDPLASAERAALLLASTVHQQPDAALLRGGVAAQLEARSSP